MTIYLCTCGTSAAKNLRPADGSRFNADYVKHPEQITVIARELLQTFQHCQMSDDKALKQVLSAEIHSLARMNVTENDTVVLFSSETLDGQACAHAVKLYLHQQLPNLQCEIEVIAGLQVDQAGKFRTQGVLNFTKRILHWIESYGTKQCVLNPTGGFKSLVPYTVLIGMIKQVEARYIFEQSSELIALPMMPIEFSQQRLEPIRTLLEQIDRDSFISKSDWEKQVPFQMRDSVNSLFEVDDNNITLSPVGLLIWEELHKPSALTPFLSRKAFDDFLKYPNFSPIDYIEKICRDINQIENAKHDSWTHGLFWLKPGNTSDRYLVSINGWRLLVWRMMLHDEYDHILDENRKADLGKRFIENRNRDYAPFVRMELYNGE